ncbi:MAG: M48 family metalloprotease [Myxococcales bacterium]|nr:M48 family metalloprotease [Myxococcales bacterium]
MTETPVHTKIPPGPESVPATLTQPTPAFRLHAWTSTLALIAFVSVYLGLTAWLGTMIYRFVRDGVKGNLFIGILQSLAPALLLFVLVRGLFAIKRGTDPKTLVEVTREQEPDLVAFIHDIADKAGAPRPHKIFLAPEVNAAVFYDLGFLNFIFPTKKNLLIGLGLLNVLTLSELRAVLAHEFGHFAQKSMAVGRWVYLAEQIAAHIVASRSRLDRWLQTLSVQDPRIAWIGWLFRLCVWAVRAVLDTMYLLVALSKRALSREMELQADLVAVSLTGSDALVHALHKAHAADQGFGAAFGTLRKELAAGVRVPDVYALQTRQIENVRRAAADPTFGLAPPLPDANRAEHRVFEKHFAQPSKMWSTHPPDREREDNIKRVYVPCALDDRSAWELFVDPAQTRRKLTDNIVAVLLEPPPAVEGAPPAPKFEAPKTELEPEQALALIDASFARAFHQPEYRGVYLGRYLARHTASSGMLFDAIAEQPWSEPAAPPIDELYPESMREDIERWKQLSLDVALIEGLRDGHLRSSDAKMNYRGNAVARWELPSLADRVRAEKISAEAIVAKRDRDLRTVHQRMARKVGHGWAAYHESLVRLVHYAEHAASDIADANGYLNNVFQIVMADGHVSQAEYQRLLAASRVAYRALANAYAQKDSIVLPPAVLDRLNRAASRREADHFPSFAARLGELQLGEPNDFNLGQWLPNAQSWLGTVPFDFESLADAAVDELLDVEAKLRAAINGGDEAIAAIEQAPAPAQFPAQYVTLEPGQERERQRTLGWWDRFQLADGVVPGVARAAVASAMLGGMAVLGNLAVSHSVYVYNGLGRPVTVTIGANTQTIHGGGYAKVSIGSEDRLHVRTVTDSGQLVEDFDADTSNGQSTYVYNVARAGLLYHFRATYGLDREIAEAANRETQPEILGNPRWTTDDSWHRFSEPEKQVTLSRGQRSTTRTLLRAPGLEVDPRAVLSSARSDEERAALVRAHVQFDPPGRALRAWLRVAPGRVSDVATILAQRASAEPAYAVEFLRAERNITPLAQRPAVCARHRQWAQAHPGAGGAYLVASCIDDNAQSAEAVRVAYERYRTDPERGYLAYAAATDAVSKGEFDRAATLVDDAFVSEAIVEDAAELATRVARVRWALSWLERYSVAPTDMSSAPVAQYASRSTEVRELLDAENGVGEHARQTVHYLARGQLSAASSAVPGENGRSYFDALLAASDGAESWRVQGVLAATSAPRGLGALWVAALAIREGRAIPAVVSTAIAERLPEFESLRQWLEAQHRLAAGSERQIPAALHQPYAMAMATIVLGSATPVRWRTIARAYFFAAERPYFSLNDPQSDPTARNESSRHSPFIVGGLGMRSAEGVGSLSELQAIGERDSRRPARPSRPSPSR